MAVTLITDSEFYAPWPLRGKHFAHQLEEIRGNQNLLKALAENLILTADPNDLAAGDFTGLEFGEENFSNKFRIIWSQSDQAFEFQCNEGTEAVPVWDTAFYVDCDENQIVFDEDSIFTKDLTLLGDFYGPSVNEITVRDTETTTFQTSKISFNRDDFYLTDDADGKPIVNTLAMDASESLSSITVTDSKVSVTSDTGTLSVNENDFYVTKDSLGNPAINLVDPEHEITFAQTDDSPLSILSDKLTVNRIDFYLTKDTTGKPILNLGGITTEGGAAVLTGILVRDFSSSVEWQFSHNFDTKPLLWGTFDTGDVAFIPEKVDVSDPNTAYFYFTEAIAGTALLSTGRVSTEVTFAETLPGTKSVDSNTVKFEKSHFYLTESSSGEAIVNFTRTISGSLTVTEGGLFGDQLIVDSSGQVPPTLPTLIASNITPGAIFGPPGPLAIIRAGTGTTRPELHLFRSRGTEGAPTALQDGDVVGLILGQAYDGSRYQTTSFISFDAQSVESPNTQGRIRWGNRKTDFLTDYMHLDADGNLEVGEIADLKNPQARVTVHGDMFVADKVTAEAFYTIDFGEVALKSDITPGFYGMSVKQTNHLTGGASFKTDALTFNRLNFYLTPDSKGDPTVNFLPELDEKSITVNFPGRNTEWDYWTTSRNIVIADSYAALTALDNAFYPSLKYSVRYAASRFDTGTELIVGGRELDFYPNANEEWFNNFDNPSIPARNVVWLEILDLGEGGGIEKQFHLTLHLRQDDI